MMVFCLDLVLTIESQIGFTNLIFEIFRTLKKSTYMRESLKASLHQLIDQIDDVALLAAFYKIISAGQTSLPFAELEQGEQNAIKSGLEDLDAEKIFSHQEIMAEVQAILNPKG
ncbi:MAG: hypothetical protein AAFN10_02975 [Bacteroidota bacterium]